MSAEQPRLPPSVEENAKTWFDPEKFSERRGEHLAHLAALWDRDQRDPFVTEAMSRLAEGDIVCATLIAEHTLGVAYAEQRAAFDRRTGLRRYEEYQRWIVSTFGRDEASKEGEEKRQSHWGHYSLVELNTDLKDLKRVNLLGERKVGDEVIRAAAQEILDALRVGDHSIAYRIGGDEFGVAGSRFSEEDAFLFWQRLQNMQNEKTANERQQYIWASIGAAVARCPDPTNYRRFIKVFPRIGMDEAGKEIKKPTLWIAGSPICDIADLAVMDIGYAFGYPRSHRDIAKIREQAEEHRFKIKKQTTERVGGPFRLSILG